MLTFDRLQLYYYHRQNLTVYSKMLLSSINSIANDRGTLYQQLLQDCNHTFCISYNSLYENTVMALDHKYKYTDDFILSRNENGLGFFANNLDYFFY